jgi:catechol 2,3-dioxygenase
MKLGHVHLKVRNLDRSVAFYSKVFHLRVTEQLGGFAFLTGSDMHHTVALQEVGAAAAAPAGHSVGLYHVAFEVPDEAALADTLHLLTEMGTAVYPVDHQISKALYFQDPDGNGLEVYLDTRQQRSSPTWGGRNLPLEIQ